MIYDIIESLFDTLVVIADVLTLRYFGLSVERRRREEERTRAAERETRTALIGRDGVAVSPLRPGGRVSIDGREYEARAEQGLIDAGAPVRVTGVSPFALIVRAAR